MELWFDISGLWLLSRVYNSFYSCCHVWSPSGTSCGFGLPSPCPDGLGTSSLNLVCGTWWWLGCDMALVSLAGASQT